jgi:hypothetical protein
MIAQMWFGLPLSHCPEPGVLKTIGGLAAHDIAQPHFVLALTRGHGSSRGNSRHGGYKLQLRCRSWPVDYDVCFGLGIQYTQCDANSHTHCSL